MLRQRSWWTGHGWWHGARWPLGCCRPLGSGETEPGAAVKSLRAYVDVVEVGTTEIGNLDMAARLNLVSTTVPGPRAVEGTDDKSAGDRRGM